MTFSDHVHVRDQLIDNTGPWTWVKQDDGAWTGPKENWEQSHKQAWLSNVKKFDVVVQAGGNCGMYPRLLAQHFKRVYTFEPDPLNFHCLVNNTQLENVIKIQAALGDENRLITVVRGGFSNVGTHTVAENNEAQLTWVVPFQSVLTNIPCMTLDTLNLDQCDFIQLDVEGYEAKVLRGAKNTIEKFKPAISCENGHVSGVKDFLVSLGYTVKLVSGADTLYVVE
jgi:FkbM family methyltransferase